jgi:hypothetical protein
MRTGTCSGVALALFLAVLVLLGNVPAAFGQTGTGEQPSAEAVAKLIAQLGADDFRSRQQASEQLEKLGAPILPTLRQAAMMNKELEIKRRIELVVKRIENNLVKAEEKHWQDFDAPRRSLKDRLVKILAKTPTLSDRQVASAVYLLILGRMPTDEEVLQAQKRFAGANGRTLHALELARMLVQGKEYRADLAATNDRLLKVHEELAGDPMEVASKLHRLNSDEFQKLIGDAAAVLHKTLKADDQLTDLAFLLVLSRFAKDNESKTVVGHLQKTKDRVMATTDIFWALVNTREFLVKQ